MRLTKIPTHDIFKLLLVIYFQKMCIVTCDLSRKNKRCFFCCCFFFFFCFLDGFGIAGPVFSY